MQERTLEELYKKLKEFDRLADKEEFLFDEIRDAVEAQVWHLPRKFATLF